MGLTMFRPLLISMFLTSTALADTWTVDDDGKADFDNIYLAVAAASDGDVILVMEGTYYSSYINPHGKALLVEGETNSKGELLVTVDGMQSGAILECYSGEGPDTIFRNLILTNGSSYYGGGMTLFDGSSPTVENCIFHNNTGTIEGGGIYLRENCNPIITNCRFEDNLASGPGGGMFCIENSNPTLTNCTFTSNTANNGGGMYNQWQSSPTLENCTFTGNTASDGGGMYNINTSSPTLTNCTFENNTAFADGGGMFNNESSPTLADTTVCGNTPDQVYGEYIDGGGNMITDECSDCPDINGDGYVNVSDLLIIIDQWGLTNSPADVNFDGIVDVSDLLIVVGNWGECE
jgi:parallel beta-helix repeat protein